MSGRLFLERVAALVGIGIATPVARAAVPGRVELQRSPVAGFQYHRGVWIVVLRDFENPWGRVEFAIFLGERGADDGR
jgi:hypothetical protein